MIYDAALNAAVRMFDRAKLHTVGNRNADGELDAYPRSKVELETELYVTDRAEPVLTRCRRLSPSRRRANKPRERVRGTRAFGADVHAATACAAHTTHSLHFA